MSACVSRIEPTEWLASETILQAAEMALKLYAGGFTSKADIVELLARNPDADLDEVRAVCER